MRTVQRAVFVSVVAAAIAALSVPIMGLRASDVGAGSTGAISRIPAARSSAVGARAQQIEQQTQPQSVAEMRGEGTSAGKITVDTLRSLGLTVVANPKAASARMAQKIKSAKKSGGGVSIQSGQPNILNSASALSAALMTTIGGRDNQFSEVTLIADWDGREDCAADREQKVDDFSFVEPEIDGSLTRTAISEHTVANGFNENVYYYGDSIGNVWVGVDTNPGVGAGPQVDTLLQINLPTVLNAFGTLNSDDQITITGLAVSPVADLTSFANVNGSFAGFAGQIGEILYVTYFDSESGLRLTSGNVPVRSGLLAFPISDLVSPAAAPPGILSGAGFPVTVGGAFGVAFSQFSMVAGCAVDDDGSVYFQQVDLIQFTGANIVKITSQDSAINQDRSLATNGFLTITTLNPTGGNYGTASGPVNQVSRYTNYSGTSTLFGDIATIATGGCNVLYAAVSRSFVAGDVSFEQLTEGLFPAPSAFGAAGTPSMVISFADCSGAFDICSGEANGSVSVNVGGTIPAADGFADVAQSGLTRTPGVNNFRLFVLGNGPDLRPAAGGTAVVPGTPSTLLKVDMQIDYTAYSGLWVNQEGTVFVISGGTPAGIGKNPSPMLGEVLCFADACAADRRADFVDLRADTLPNPPASGGNVGDGDSDRFDHIFYQAPLDQLTLTPGGLAGLAGGFLRYTNRLAPNEISPGVLLGVTGGKTVQGDDDTDGTIIFEKLDPGHQVAGGDDQNTPFRGDDDDGAGTPPVPGPLSGGFEFVFGGPVGTAGCVWNGFFLNSNGNITFGDGDTDNTATVPEFRTGFPKIAPAWADLNPNARAATLRCFPVQALGYANINAFKVRWINVPEFGSEGCVGTQAAGSLALLESGVSNTFSVTLYDDGKGIDENANQPLNPANPIGNNAVPFDLQEGPTDLRFTREPNTGVLVGCSPRPEGSGIIIFDYCRMDLLGTDSDPVLTGYSIGGLDPLNPPGLCEINLSKAAAAADTNPFGVLADTNGETANICANCCIGEGTEPTLFEFFNEGLTAETGAGGEVTLARPDFDLRFEGNDSVLCSSARQRDLNRGRVCLYGVGCAPPPNPSCLAVVPGTFVTNPTTTGIINALCAVQLNLVGCGFYPNEVTTICQGFQTETGIPLQRPGKTVTTAATLACDTNGDGIAEAVIVLTGVTPVNCNLVRATAAVLSSAPGTAFPDTCCGGTGTITVTTSFSAGDNNAFGPFTRTSVCTLALGTRAPVVYSITPSNGNCALPSQDLLISGACFCINGPSGPVANVTSVIFQDKANPANTVTVGLSPSASGQVKPVTCQLLDVEVNFTSANAGKTFLVYVTGPNGSSRNLAAAVAGAPAGCPLGNEQGFQVTFACTFDGGPQCPPGVALPGCPCPVGVSDGTNGCVGTPVDVALVNGCKLDRNPAGNFILDVFGKNLKLTADVRVGSITPRAIKPREPDPSFPGGFLHITLKGRICDGLPGSIVVTNPPAVPGGPTVPSQPFACTERCPAN